MIECLFTIDYEIYGNGQGSLQELIYEPAERLMAVFREADARFVAFVEAAELEIIEANGTDAAIELVRKQISEFHEDGFEIGLHLHPQWYNARHKDGEWILDYSEYNLCTLKRERIEWIIQKALDYLRGILKEPGFTPVSFRAGNWLLQPTRTAAAVLAEKGFRIDSSVFKGGRQHAHGLDYRQALRNGYFWKFQDDANIEVSNGQLLEIPTHTRMVPFWQMLTAKRLATQQKTKVSAKKVKSPGLRRKTDRILDLLRFRYPLKFDFCRMTFDELRTTLDKVIRDDRSSPDGFRPLVAIGHTKDLHDFETVRRFLNYLQDQGIKVSTFAQVYERCVNSEAIPAGRA